MEATRAAQVFVPGSRIEHRPAKEQTQGSVRTAGGLGQLQERVGDS